MGAKRININPTCWAVAGDYQGLKYDNVVVTPLLEKEKIQFSIITKQGESKEIDEVPFPVQKQTEQTFIQIIKQVFNQRLRVLL